MQQNTNLSGVDHFKKVSKLSMDMNRRSFLKNALLGLLEQTRRLKKFWRKVVCKLKSGQENFS